MSNKGFSFPKYATTDSTIMPIKKEEYFSITINEELYKSRVRLCEDSLIGHLILYKRDQPWKLEDLRA